MKGYVAYNSYRRGWLCLVSGQGVNHTILRILTGSDGLGFVVVMYASDFESTRALLPTPICQCSEPQWKPERHQPKAYIPLTGLIETYHISVVHRQSIGAYQAVESGLKDGLRICPLRDDLVHLLLDGSHSRRDRGAGRKR